MSEIGPGQALKQRTVSLSGDEDGVDLVLDFDDSDRLLGVEFLHPAHVPPGW